jgi:mono/diheme cytochrome c family protein
MNRTIGLTCASVLFFLTALLMAAGQDARTQWDGVYTKTQSENGGQLYAKYCASCHGADLSGGELAPPLTGGDFNANWNDLPLGGLFERMRVSMPQNNPGSLGTEENVQILAYILSKGGFPAGETELPTQAGKLSTIKFAALKPER